MPLVLQVALQIPVRRSFDYLAPPGVSAAELTPGLRLAVPFGRNRRVGFLVGTSEIAQVDTSRLKTVEAVLDAESLLSGADLELLRWAAGYYHHPLGEVLAAAFPVPLRQTRKAELPGEPCLCLTAKGRDAGLDELRRSPRQRSLLERLKQSPEGFPLSALADREGYGRRAARELIRKGWCGLEERTSPATPAGRIEGHVSPELSPAQRAAVEAVQFGRYATYLLEGVTGSGKTEVYLQLSRLALARGEQVLVLLPEISLTPQLEQRFRQRFSAPIAVFHSGRSETERLRAWLEVQRGIAPILLGTRSAVFSPLRRPALIVVDEEHDPSFKQQDGFRFSARDVAVRRAQVLGIPVVLGSATPALESLWNVARGRYRRLSLPERVGASSQPQFHILDIRNERLQDGLSKHLLRAMRDTMELGEQVLLFLNRRGFAPTLICHACGWVAPCPRCDARLVIHAREQRLRCHHCAHEAHLPDCCPYCSGTDLRPLGLGTERVGQALERLFPGARTARIDRDSLRGKESLKTELARIHAGEVNILLGTQMLAKGHHFPKVTLVGILDVDAALYSTDFRAEERTAQLIVQVAGRSGRAERPGTVLLQTRHPDHPLLSILIDQGYGRFAAAALEERRQADLPPLSHWALWRAEGAESAAPLEFLRRVRAVAEAATGGVAVLGPAPAPMLRQAGRYRYQLVFQSADRKRLHGLLDNVLAETDAWPERRRVRWSIDIDPIDCY